MQATDLFAMGVLIVSVVATFWIARRRSGRRGDSSGSHRPVGRGGSLDFVTAGRRVSRSNRRILSPTRITGAHLRRNRSITKLSLAVKVPGKSSQTPGGPRYV